MPLLFTLKKLPLLQIEAIAKEEAINAFIFVSISFKNLQTQPSKILDGSRDWYTLSGRQIAIGSQILTVLPSSDLVIVLLEIHPKEIIRGKG